MELLVAEHVMIYWTVLQGVQHVSLHEGTKMKTIWQAPFPPHSQSAMGRRECQFYYQTPRLTWV